MVYNFQISKRRDKLLNYMLFLRITPTLPNLFINLASPIVDVPFHVFFLATLIGLVPAAYITVRVSSFACLLHHLSIYDMHSAFLCFISFRHLHKVRRRVLKFSFFLLQAGLAIGDLKSVKDLYDFKTLSVLFLIGFISILPTILKRKKIVE